MEFLSLSLKRPSARNLHSGEERGETDVFAGYYKTSLPIGVGFLLLVLLQEPSPPG